VEWVAASRRRRSAESPDQGTNLDDLQRELQMIRAGLYEQGRRISVLAEQLREELRASSRQ
jgi:hypothetical protein